MIGIHSKEFSDAVHSHIRKHGSGNWGLVRELVPKASEATFWRVLKRVRNKPWSAPVVLKPDIASCDNGQSKDASGFIYVIFIDTKNGIFYKVGKSNSPMARISSHQTSCPFEVKVAGIYFSSDMGNEEREIHAMFSHKRVRGEWFRLDSSDVASISARALKV